MCVEFLLCWRVVVDVVLRTKNVKVTDVGFLTPEYFVRSLAFDCSSWQVVLGVDSVFNDFSPEWQWKLGLNEDGSDTIHKGKVEMFQNTILFWSAWHWFLMNHSMFLYTEFPLTCDVFTTIIKTEYLEFLTGLVFNFLVPGLEGFESFTFLVEIVDPQVARGVISEGDKVEFSTKWFDRWWSPEVWVCEIKNFSFQGWRLQ